MVSKEELLHIAELSDLKIDESEISNYQKNLDDILNYTQIISKIDSDNLPETIGANDNYNCFREDEIKAFDNIEGIIDDAPSIDRGMYNLPSVIN